MGKTRIAIIGAGSLGVGLAVLLSRKGYLLSLGSRNPKQAKAALKSLSLPEHMNIAVVSPKNAVKGADLSVLCVTDLAIAEVCSDLLTNFEPESVICHCSGSLDSLVLESAAEQGLHVCSAHPLNSFPSRAAACALFANDHHNTPVFCEGDQTALMVIQQIFSNAGFSTQQISRESKPLYHAASVLACNYLTVLMDCSLQAGAAAGLDRGPFWKALKPLIETTLVNIDHSGTEHALSGPIARGDVATVAGHVKALSEVSEQLANSYRQLGKQTVELAKRSNRLDENTIAKLIAILS